MSLMYDLFPIKEIFLLTNHLSRSTQDLDTRYAGGSAKEVCEVHNWVLKKRNGEVGIQRIGRDCHRGLLMATKGIRQTCFGAINVRMREKLLTNPWIEMLSCGHRLRFSTSCCGEMLHVQNCAEPQITWGWGLG